MKEYAFFAIFVLVQTALGARVAHRNCTATEHTPQLSEYFTEIIVRCGSVEKKILGSSPVWKNDDTLALKRFVNGNFFVSAELILPKMVIRDLSTTPQPLVAIETNGIVSADALEIRDEFIPSKSGYNIPVNFVRLRNHQLPTGFIFYVHGGSASPGGMAPRGIDYSFSPVAKQILERGYTLVNLSYRGDSIFSEGDYLKLGDKNDRHPRDYYRGEILDLLAVENFVLQKYPNVKIIYHGVSHGALLVNLLAGKYADQTKASGFFSDSGIWDLPTASNDPSGAEKMSWYLMPHNPTPQVNWNDYGKQWNISNPIINGLTNAEKILQRRLLAGETNFVVFYSPSKAEFLDRNPATYMKQIKTPLLIRHGRNDVSVSYKQHEKLKHDLAANPNPFVQPLTSEGSHGMQDSDLSDIRIYLEFIDKAGE
jgi:hypothetical protein